jgi:hypothetical protein
MNDCETLIELSRNHKHIPFLLIREREHNVSFIREYTIIYDYEDNTYYQTGNTKLKPNDKDIKRIFKELTIKAKTTTKYNPETKIYLKFPKQGIRQQEIHKGIGIVTEVCVECGKPTDITLETIYPDWLDLFHQPTQRELEFNNLTPLEL